MKGKTRALRVLDLLGIRYSVRGRRAWARCPFHSDKDPSWFVDVMKGGHHCFSCKAGGTLARLVMHVRGVSMKEAIAFIDGQGKGFEPERVRARIAFRQAEIVRIGFRLPAGVYLKPLAEWPTPFRRYAQDERHITAEQVDRFGLGYALEGKLQGRIVFPVRDARGRVVSYSARDFTDQLEERYLTPHERDGADLDGLFGENLWPAREARTVIVVNEGAINALAVDRAASLPSTSIGGSDVRLLHVAKLSTFPLVILLTDPDLAGNKAAQSFRRMLARHTETVRPRLPKGQDADTMSPDALGENLRSAAFAGSD